MMQIVISMYENGYTSKGMDHGSSVKNMLCNEIGGDGCNLIVEVFDGDDDVHAKKIDSSLLLLKSNDPTS